MSHADALSQGSSLSSFARRSRTFASGDHRNRGPSRRELDLQGRHPAAWDDAIDDCEGSPRVSKGRLRWTVWVLGNQQEPSEKALSTPEDSGSFGKTQGYIGRRSRSLARAEVRD